VSEPIHTDEWLIELARLSAVSDEGQSVIELMAATGFSEKTMLRRLKTAMGLGWVRVGYRASVSLIGKPYLMPVYRVEVPK
jgi:hypothetical protein